MKFSLTAREKSELIGEAIVTIILLLLLNMSIFMIINQEISSNPGLQNGIFQIKMSLFIGPTDIQIWSWGGVFIMVMFIADGGIVYWRLMRRYRQMQLRHVIAELHYIASGHFDHRIPFKLHGQMQRVVESVNSLVDSTINAMEEERRIERSKDELVTNVSHDIRTPLTSVIGYLGLIEDKQYKTDDELLKYTHIAFIKAKQMKSLVDDLFEYTKVRQEGVTLNIMPLDIGAMLEQIAAGYELEAHKKGMQVNVDVPEKPIEIEADGEKLARVFNNLVSNALKYGVGGKNIYLSAKLIEPSEVQIMITNDGEAIPEESLQHIFDRFYRAEGSRSRETGGSGLGLAIAQGIIERHFGYIYVTSDEKMTKFVMRLPLRHDKTIMHMKRPQKENKTNQ